MSDVYLWDTYQKVGREALERRDYEQAITSLKAAVSVAEQLPGEELRLVLSLRLLSSATSKAGQLSLAHELLSHTKEIAVSRLGDGHSETVQVKRELYDFARQLGHLDQAEGYLHDVLEAVRAHGETEEYLEIMELLAELVTERGRFDDATALYHELAQARTTLYGEEHPSVAQALLWYSTALSRNGQGEDAEASLTQAFSMLEKQFINDPKSLAQSLLAGSELMLSSGRPQAALEHQKRAIAILGENSAPGDTSLWDAKEMLASTLANLGELPEAIELLEECLKHRQERDHRTGALLKNLAGLYLATHQIERAEELYRDASELLHQTLGPDHPASLATLEERIQLYHFTGRSQEALTLALSTVRPTEERYGPGHPNTAQVYASTAVLAHAARNWDTAYELMKAAEAIWETLAPRPDDVLSNCRLNMATCLVELGRNAEAGLLLQKVAAAPGSPAELVVQQLWARLESPVDPEPDATVEEAQTPSEPESSTPSVQEPEELPQQETSAAAPQPQESSSSEHNSCEEGQERRLFRRFNLGMNRFFELSVCNSEGERSVVKSFLVDLSAGGLRVNSECPLPLDERFDLTLPPEVIREELTLRAKVTWQRALFGASYIQGVEFLELTPEQREHIENVLNDGGLSEGGRQHYRLYRPFPIQVSLQESTDWIPCYASDLSLEGLGTRLDTVIPPGQEVRLRLGLEFELPTVEVTATVAWNRSDSNGISHGLRFDNVGPVEARTIRLYIDRCLELSPD